MGSCWLHFRLKLCRSGGGGGEGSGVAGLCCLHCRLRSYRMAGSCWFHSRLRLCRTAGSCCIHCRLRLTREGEDGGFLLDSL